MPGLNVPIPRAFVLFVALKRNFHSPFLSFFSAQCPWYAQLCWKPGGTPFFLFCGFLDA